jgi:hypothetical protein
LDYHFKLFLKHPVWIHIFLTLAVLGSEWSASRPGRFTTGKNPRLKKSIRERDNLWDQDEVVKGNIKMGVKGV